MQRNAFSTGRLQVKLSLTERKDDAAVRRLAQLLFGNVDLDAITAATTTTGAHHMMSTTWGQLDSTSYAGGMST